MGALRLATTAPRPAGLPVICVGNLVAGGAGKTPVALALGRLLAEHGLRAHFLTRGYGGREPGPLRVAVGHDFRDVGDEALLLAALAPTWVARDRLAGASAARAAGAQMVIMDDGFQNPALHKDLSLLVVDGGYGFGNGLVMPAGPLREPIQRGLDRAQAVVLVGEDRCGALALVGDKPVLRADLVAGPEAIELAGKRVVAFAGIGRPQKFFDSLGAIGCVPVETHAYADHHPYTDAEGAFLAARARSLDARLVTTAKDFLRLPQSVRALAGVLTVSLEWRNGADIDRILADLVKV